MDVSLVGLLDQLSDKLSVVLWECLLDLWWGLSMDYLSGKLLDCWKDCLLVALLVRLSGYQWDHCGGMCSGIVSWICSRMCCRLLCGIDSRMRYRICSRQTAVQLECLDSLSD